MNDTLILGAGQAHELELAFRRNDWTNALIKKLSEGEILEQVRLVLLGQAEITVVKHIIDLSADPFIPSALFEDVEHHEKGPADFEWDPAKARLHLSKNQKGQNTIEGNNLRKELASESPFNANLLDYLLKNPHLIPEEWKKDEAGNTRYTYFWGTIYRDSDGRLCVRCLCWSGTEWDWDCRWLGFRWRSLSPAACLAQVALGSCSL